MVLRVHIADACVAAESCMVLLEMLKYGLTTSSEATAALAEAARRTHPSDASVQKRASDLIDWLLASHPTPSTSAGVSLEHAALDRVSELQRRRDFASLVRDMDAFPECEELQVAGCEAIRQIIFQGGSLEEAAAAGAVECVVRAVDLFRHSGKTLSRVE